MSQAGTLCLNYFGRNVLFPVPRTHVCVLCVHGHVRGACWFYWTIDKCPGGSKWVQRFKTEVECRKVCHAKARLLRCNFRRRKSEQKYIYRPAGASKLLLKAFPGRARAYESWEREKRAGKPAWNAIIINIQTLYVHRLPDLFKAHPYLEDI